jgi:hypothetical protein
LAHVPEPAQLLVLPLVLVLVLVLALVRRRLVQPRLVLRSAAALPSGLATASRLAWYQLH